MGFAFIYEAVWICGKAAAGGRFDLPPDPRLFTFVYGLSLICLVGVVVLGMVELPWVVPTVGFFVVGPLLSVLIFKRIRAGAFVVQALAFSIVGVLIASVGSLLLH